MPYCDPTGVIQQVEHYFLLTSRQIMSEYRHLILNGNSQFDVKIVNKYSVQSVEPPCTNVVLRL